MSDEPKVIDTVQDLAWFEKVLRESRGVLSATPEGSQPSWYRQYMAARKPNGADT